MTSPEPTPRRDNSDLPEHRVAMVLFTTVRAVDHADAAFIARRAVVEALTPTAIVRPYQPVTITARLRDGEVPVQVSEVTDIGAAGYAGYLQITPTSQGYPREEGE